MLSNFKKFVKDKQTDISVVLGVIFISLFSFGVGLLVSFNNGQGPIIIQNPINYSASIEESLPDKEKETEGKFIGSVNSDKYHWPDCPWAKKISEENRIWFNSEKEAQDAGYVRCGSFEKYIPLNY